MRGRRGNRPGTEAVIAAEHERNRPFLDRGARGLIYALADLGDVLDELLSRIAVLLRFRNGRWEIAPIDHHAAERRDLFAEARDAKRGRPHIDATAAPAHVEGYPDQMNRRSHRATITVRRKNRRSGDQEKSPTKPSCLLIF